MRCPSCKRELVVIGKAYLETLNEHVTSSPVILKDKYICPSEECETQVHKVSWNENGESYYRTFNVPKTIFIDKNDAPFGSFQRKANVEIFKNDEDYIFLKIGKFVVKRTFRYKSNEDGDILSRKGRFTIIIGGVYYISGVRMLLFSFRQFRMCKKYGKKYEIREKDKRWWARISKWWFKTFYPNHIVIKE